MSQQERAAAYGRSSSDRQETSCRQQHEWALGKAAALGLDLVAWYEDDGVPGDRLDRPGLEALFADLERRQRARHPVRVLLLFDQDRLSRGTSWAAGALMERLARHGVERVVMATKELDLYDDTGRAIYGLEQDLAKRGYVKSISRNVSRAAAQRALAGFWNGGPAPYAYCLTGPKHGRTLVPGPAEEVEALRELFRLAAEGWTTWELARLANEKGWPVPVASARRQKGRAPVWTGDTVWGILRQPAYAGAIAYGRRRKGKYHQATSEGPVERRGPSQEPAPPILRWACHESLVDRAVWDRVQALLASRRLDQHVGRRLRGEFVFSGKLVCGCCGKVMQGRHDHGTPVYVCSTWRHKRGCSRNGVKESVLLDRVAELLTRELSTPATIGRLRKELESRRSGHGETSRRAVEKGRQQVADLERLLEDGGRRLLSVSRDMVPLVEKELRRQAAELATARTDLEEAERHLLEAQAEGWDVEELLGQLSRLPELLRGADAAQRTRVVQLAVAKVVMKFDVQPSPRGLRQLSTWRGGKVSLTGHPRAVDMSPLPGNGCRSR
jgi:DNA invertase Pin-like site-specific DNA recombinase